MLTLVPTSILAISADLAPLTFISSIETGGSIEVDSYLKNSLFGSKKIIFVMTCIGRSNANFKFYRGDEQINDGDFVIIDNPPIQGEHGNLPKYYVKYDNDHSKAIFSMFYPNFKDSYLYTCIDQNNTSSGIVSLNTLMGVTLSYKKLYDNEIYVTVEAEWSGGIKVKKVEIEPFSNNKSCGIYTPRPCRNIPETLHYNVRSCNATLYNTHWWYSFTSIKARVYYTTTLFLESTILV